MASRDKQRFPRRQQTASYPQEDRGAGKGEIAADSGAGAGARAPKPGDDDITVGGEASEVHERPRGVGEPGTAVYAAGIGAHDADSGDAGPDRKRRASEAKVREVGKQASAEQGGAKDADVDLGHGRDRTYCATGDAEKAVGGMGGTKRGGPSDRDRAPSSGAPRETEGMGGAEEDDDVAMGPDWEQLMRIVPEDATDPVTKSKSADTDLGGSSGLVTSGSLGAAGWHTGEDVEIHAASRPRAYSGASGALDEDELGRPQGAHKNRGPNTGPNR